MKRTILIVDDAPSIRSKFAAPGCDTVIDTVRGVGYKVGSCR